MCILYMYYTGRFTKVLHQTIRSTGHGCGNGRLAQLQNDFNRQLPPAGCLFAIHVVLVQSKRQITIQTGTKSDPAHSSQHFLCCSSSRSCLNAANACIQNPAVFLHATTPQAVLHTKVFVTACTLSRLLLRFPSSQTQHTLFPK